MGRPFIVLAGRSLHLWGNVSLCCSSTSSFLLLLPVCFDVLLKIFSNPLIATASEYFPLFPLPSMEYLISPNTAPLGCLSTLCCMITPLILPLGFDASAVFSAFPPGCFLHWPPRHLIAPRPLSFTGFRLHFVYNHLDSIIIHNLVIFFDMVLAV